MTFHEWSVLWLAFKRNKVAASQRNNLRCYLEHVNGYLGGMELGDIRVADVDKMLDDLTTMNPNTGKPMSRQMLANIRSTASCVFEYAIDADAVSRNPARKCPISKYAPVDSRRSLTKAEQLLVVSVYHRARLGALVMMLAGLRRGELIPLMWDDVDLDELKIHVTRSVSLKGNRFQVKPGTKTTKDGRVVDIPVELGVELEQARRDSPGSYVCARSDGSMHSLVSWRRMWDSYMKTLTEHPMAKGTRIEEMTPHYLRHTYATLLYISGVDVLTASKLMGHSNVRTTIAIYTHLDNLMVTKSVAKLDDYVTQNLYRSQGSVG